MIPGGQRLWCDMTDPAAVLDIRNLKVDYASERGIVRAVNDVSFAIQPGEIFGLAGESGCGKSTIALSILRLLGAPAVIRGGQILHEGIDILAMNDASLRQLRWRKISMVFQSAMNALNPVMKVGDQLADVIMRHDPGSRSEVRLRVRELLQIVGIDPARSSAYPHELSGGMRQRVVIALSLALRPSLIIMDEPTTALDVMVQREIMDEIRRLQQMLGFSILFITHDMSLLVELADRIAIMYAGEVVEYAPASILHRQPAHPYTVGLMDSFPSLFGENRRLAGIPGSPPDMGHPPAGCRFHDRCPRVMPRCREIAPEWSWPQPDHGVRCHVYGGQEEQA